ncbi:MAG: hypothetical protein R3C56_02980 [Pirellulaceae bacterium]
MSNRVVGYEHLAIDQRTQFTPDLFHCWGFAPLRANAMYLDVAWRKEHAVDE